METRRTVTVIVNVMVGLAAVVVGLVMLPFPFNLVWGLFNSWLWIASPAVILWAKDKDAEKQS